MYRLFEVNKINDKESQSIYSFDDFTAMEAEYETKLGAWMKNNDLQGELLIMLGGSLETLGMARIGDAELSPRLIEVKTTNEENETVSKYDTTRIVSANFHSKLGSAMKNEEVKIEVLKGIDGNGNQIEYRSWIRPIPIVVPEPEVEPIEEEPEEPTEGE